jgi:hypothetical protein
VFRVDEMLLTDDEPVSAFPPHEKKDPG